MATRNVKTFNYSQLTWPEVAKLRRDTPLILPLGSGYDDSMLTNYFSNQPQIGIMPSFPFGWQGSEIALPKEIFSKYITNLLESLREDGFTQVYVLAPDRIDIGSDDFVLHGFYKNKQEDSLVKFTESDRSKVVLIPIGHIEQHGHHLPLSVDSDIIDAIAKGVISKMATRSMALDVMPYGVSTHRSSFAGTMNAGGRAFEDFWVAVIDQLTARGFDRFYFLSGHGGNMSFLVNIVKFSGERHRRIFCATAFLHTSGRTGSEALAKYRQSKTGGMGHACELETSFMLHLHPELCHMERVVDEVDFITTPSYYMDWIEGGALIANPPWDDDTKTGAYGAGSLASAEKGRLWLEAAIDEKAGHVLEIHEQQERREKRRLEGYGLWGEKKRIKVKDP